MKDKQVNLFGDDEPAPKPAPPAPKPSKVEQVCAEIKEHEAAKESTSHRARPRVPVDEQVRILTSAIERAIRQLETDRSETAKTILAIGLVDAQIPIGGTS